MLIIYFVLSRVFLFLCSFIAQKTVPYLGFFPYKELLVEWLEDFKSKLGEYQEAQETIKECERALALYKQVVDAVKVPLMVQNARKARRADGCCLEYGLEYHLRNFKSAVS